MKKVSLIGFLILTLMFSSSVITFAADTFTEDNVRTQFLKAGQNNEFILDEVSAVIYPDGRISIETKGTKKAGTPELIFDIFINLEEGTYKTELLREKTEFNISSDEYYNIETSASGTYTAEVRVVTRDLPLIELASTANFLRWTINQNGTVNWNSYNYDWSTYSGITNWYVDWSTSLSPWYENNQTAVNTSNIGRYINWDWWEPNIATYTQHSVRIRGQNDANFTYWVNWDHWGEHYLLLHGRVFVN